jgi:hypothetical protein
MLTIAVTGFVWLAAEPAVAQKTKGKTRPAETKDLMRGIMQPNCAGVGKGLKENPSDDKAWALLTQQAVVLNEMSYLLMDDGRCPDKVWAAAAKSLRESSLKVADASKAKDAAAAKEAFKGVTSACAECHKAHRVKS